MRQSNMVIACLKDWEIIMSDQQGHMQKHNKVKSTMVHKFA